MRLTHTEALEVLAGATKEALRQRALGVSLDVEDMRQMGVLLVLESRCDKRSLGGLARVLTRRAVLNYLRAESAYRKELRWKKMSAPRSGWRWRQRHLFEGYLAFEAEAPVLAYDPRDDVHDGLSLRRLLEKRVRAGYTDPFGAAPTRQAQDSRYATFVAWCKKGLEHGRWTPSSNA